jgi:hypothetical protein
MERSKIVAIITGALSILLAIAYLLLVQLLDFRGEMQPAPVSEGGVQQSIAILPVPPALPQGFAQELGLKG